MLERIDHESRLYVLKCGSGYTCLGFDVAQAWGSKSAAWLGEPAPSAPIGTPEAYAEYSAIMARGAAHCARTGKRDPSGLSPQLVGMEGKRVEVEDMQGARRRFKVGKSTGWRPCHLELKTDRARGGCAADEVYRSVRRL